MTQLFEQKLEQLNKKITTLQKPQSLSQRRNKSKSKFLQICRNINERFEVLERSLMLIQNRVNKYQQKISAMGSTINQFSREKYERLRQLLQQKVENFNMRIKIVKKEVKQYETELEVKMNEIDKQNEVIANNLYEKIKRNIEKVKSEMLQIQKRCNNEREGILGQFRINKMRIQKILKERQQKREMNEKQISSKKQYVEQKIDRLLHVLSQKWGKKDEKTKKILQILIEEDI